MSSTTLPLILALLGGSGLIAVPLVRKQFGENAAGWATVVSSVLAAVGAYQWFKTTKWSRAFAVLSAAALLFWTLQILFPAVDTFFERHPWLSTQTACLLAAGVLYGGEQKHLRWFGRIFVLLIPVLWAQDLMEDPGVHQLASLSIAYASDWISDLNRTVPSSDSSNASALRASSMQRTSDTPRYATARERFDGVTVDVCGRTEPYSRDNEPYPEFGGVWTGNWNNGRVCAWLIVRSSQPSYGSAKIQYGYVTTTGRTVVQSGLVHVYDGELKFVDRDGSHFTFSLQSRNDMNSEMNAAFIDENNNTFYTTFVRIH